MPKNSSAIEVGFSMSSNCLIPYFIMNKKYVGKDE